ncbi:flavin reductase [Vallitalea pronyensis]|uniref:Flavin reductase n=1 Tax=Vallitalea pronyensis TaxID=1348613 RepID=A0A8J8ML11_9FIRM|nr:flavin reductase [Vallitalea pronyensis]QUI23469.1 flavin reductase [Vallitalea pronyensis]
MKKEFSTRPEVIDEQFLKYCGGFSWYDFVTAMPALVFLVTGWKSNGKENACLQSWSTFVGGGTNDFICILGRVGKHGHMYRSLKETGVCVINFPSYDIYDRCIKTIGNNEFETDEITAVGLTMEKATKVDAPRIKECHLNIECELLWEHELFQGSDDMTIALKAVNICMESDHYNQDKLSRYGKTGYLFQVDQPTNPETGEITSISTGTFEPREPLPWNTK